MYSDLTEFICNGFDEFHGSRLTDFYKTNSAELKSVWMHKCQIHVTFWQQETAILCIQ